MTDKINDTSWPDVETIYKNDYRNPYYYRIEVTEDNLRFLAEKINELIDLVPDKRSTDEYVELRKFVSDLRSYDEACEPADGWYIAYNDLQCAADEIERLTTEAGNLVNALQEIQGSADAAYMDTRVDTFDHIAELAAAAIAASGTQEPLK